VTYRKPLPEERCRYTEVVERYRGGCHNKAVANGLCRIHGGKRPTMTPAQLKTAAALLEIASRSFSNHGCNDFRLRTEAKLTDEEAREIIAGLNSLPDFKDDPIPLDTKYTYDWLLMSYLAKVLREHLPSPPECPKPAGDLPPASPVAGQLAPGSYQHFKGGFYTVLGEASDSETQALVVIYMGEDGRIWSRPKAMFIEPVMWPDGVMRPRFSRPRFAR